MHGLAMQGLTYPLLLLAVHGAADAEPPPGPPTRLAAHTRSTGAAWL